MLIGVSSEMKTAVGIQSLSKAMKDMAEKR